MMFATVTTAAALKKKINMIFGKEWIILHHRWNRIYWNNKWHQA
jgi:hypothetical protein